LAASPSHGSILRKAAQTALPASPPKSTITLAHPTVPSRGPSRNTAAVPVPQRQSTVLPKTNGEDDNLLLASTIPIPEDSDSEPEESVNLMSFSAPFEMYPPVPAAPKSTSEARSLSPKSSVDSRPTLLSTPDHIQGEVVEDALRARAEQAESAAERLLELVEPEENGFQHSTIPASLLLGSNGSRTPKPNSKASSGLTVRSRMAPPATPQNQNAAILRQASQFKNSPAYNGTSPSLIDMLKDRKNETSWWLKRMNSA
jgi:CLIP-associating protein 1/2